MCCWKAHCLTSCNSIRLPYENSQRPKTFIQKNSVQRDHLFWWKCSLCNLLRERSSAKCQPQSSGTSRTKPGGKWHAVHILLCLLSGPTSLSYKFFIWKFAEILYIHIKFYPAWNFYKHRGKNWGNALQHTDLFPPSQTLWKQLIPTAEAREHLDHFWFKVQWRVDLGGVLKSMEPPQWNP